MKSKVQEMAESKFNELKEAYSKGCDTLANAVIDCLDYDFYVRKDAAYNGAVITLSYGGPTIYLDTLMGKLVSHWGDDECEIDLRHEAPGLLEAVDDVCENVYEQVRL